MIVVLYVHYNDEPIAREICRFEELESLLRDMGLDRLDKVIITDFRPVSRKNAQGEEETICP